MLNTSLNSQDSNQAKLAKGSCNNEKENYLKREIEGDFKASKIWKYLGFKFPKEIVKK